MIRKTHLSWFNLKCPYPANSKEYLAAKGRLQGATHSDLERLRAGFDEYDDGSIPVRFYSLGEHWYSTTGNPVPALNLKGIQRHGNCYRVQKRIGGEVRKWSFKTLQEAIDKRDALFAVLAPE
jgi:hypothetical protein